MKTRSGKPIVYNYRQSHLYLADLLRWHKERGLSMRNLAKRLNVSVSLLSLISKGKRPLTEENVDVWAPIFGWNAQEVSWIKQLVLLEHSPIENKKQAIENLSRFNTYREQSSQEVLTFKYLKKWWNVAIREMSELPDFQEDENWIQDKLLFKVSLTEIRKALKFLNKHKLLAKYGDFRRLDCMGDIYRLSLSTFHAQVLNKAVESIHTLPSEERYILGHTMTINKEKFSEAKAILEEALEKVTSLNAKSDAYTDVYHFSFLGFPLTSKEPK